MIEVKHRIVETNGIRMHLAEAGMRPLVLLCHGFPNAGIPGAINSQPSPRQGSTLWRPICAAMARLTAPRQSTSIPCCIWSGDMVDLVDALGEEKAVIAGHDWGAAVAWLAAQLRPDRFRGVVGLSVPFRSRGPVRPTTAMPQTDDAIWYQLYFQEPGIAEAEYDRNVRVVFHAGAIAISGDAPPTTRPFGMVRRRGSPFRWNAEPPRLPAWLTEADIDFFTAEFTRTGFRGGLNWYRNIDRNWELLAPFDGLPVTVPALYVAGDRDPVMRFPGMDRHIADLEKFVPQLCGTMMLPGCGHLIQRERPVEVNAAIIDFLRQL